MKLKDIIDYQFNPDSIWDGDTKIPWDDPAFSRRMLREHLSQGHDMASRRRERIADQVSWMHRAVLGERASKILDLGCGPGLYIRPLAALGHSCTGIDFSPASVEHARQQAAGNKKCEIIQGDIRDSEYGEDNDLVLILFGELDTFAPGECEGILRKVSESLVPGGRLLIETHTFDAVRRKGNASGSWFKSESGLLSDQPHIWLIENKWFDDHRVARTDTWIVESESKEVHHYVDTIQARSDEEYRDLLKRCGFRDVLWEGNWGEKLEDTPSDFQVILAQC